MGVRNLRFTFKCAFRGLRIAFGELTIQGFLLVSILVVGLMFWLDVSFIQKTILLLVIGINLSLELLNSQIEHILDYFCPTE